MKIIATLVTLIFIAPGAAQAICVRSIDDTIEKELKEANFVFVATLTEAHISRGINGLPELTHRGRGGTWYTVQYAFEVAIPIKGDPSAIPYLTTVGLWQDPKELVFTTFAEQSKFVPGDNILVIADASGEVPISDIGCTGSMPWNKKAYDLLRNTNLLPPNNSFKPKPLRGSA